MTISSCAGCVLFGALTLSNQIQTKSARLLETVFLTMATATTWVTISLCAGCVLFDTRSLWNQIETKSAWLLETVFLDIVTAATWMAILLCAGCVLFGALTLWNQIQTALLNRTVETARVPAPSLFSIQPTVSVADAQINTPTRSLPYFTARL